MVFLRTVAAVAALTASVSAHSMPAKQEIAIRDTLLHPHKRALNACSSSASARSLAARAVNRRATHANEIRSRLGFDNEHITKQRRDTASLEKWAAISHNSSAAFTLDTPAAEIFASNATPVLVPQSVIGPYWVSGELVRSKMSDELLLGVPLYLDVQFIDVETCQGVPNLMIDSWHCNATGIYSGVAAEGQGGLNSTFGRAVQITDDDGVVQFESIVPGHYTGRAHHIHVLATADAQTYPNGTWYGGINQHIGQLYFDQNLMTEVEKTSPYNTNTQELTTVLEDMLAPASATELYDPFLNYVQLGPNVEDGFLFWISIGINTTSNHTDLVADAAHYLEGGGVAIENPKSVPYGPFGAGSAASTTVPTTLVTAIATPTA